MKKYFTCLISSLFVFFTSCEKFVDPGNPTHLVVTSGVFKSNETAIAAMIGIYASMMTTSFPTPYRLSEMTGLYGDEFKYELSAPASLNVYTNSLNSKDAATNSIWINGYKYIYQANSIIAGLEKSENLSPAIKDQLTGEALFIRSLWHFYLANLYGDIPWIESIDYNKTSVQARLPVQTIYENIVKDLKAAQVLVSENYLAGNSMTVSTDRFRPNKSVISSFLARIYLYKRDWEISELECDKILTNSLYKMETITNVFKSISKETIWQMQMPTGIGYPTFEATNFILTAKPTGVRDKTLSPFLISQFAPIDKRLSNWIGTYSDNVSNPMVRYNYSYKYKSTTGTDENTICFRLAEIYLIRSEARAQRGNLQGSFNDINEVRTRAGLLKIENEFPGINQAQLLNEILNERQRELFAEWGHRWMDLRRTRKVLEVMKVVTPAKSGKWNDNLEYWPIPLTDILSNKNLKQNEGYND